MNLRVQSDPMEEKQFHRSGICDAMVRLPSGPRRQALLP